MEHFSFSLKWTLIIWIPEPLLSFVIFSDVFYAALITILTRPHLQTLAGLDLETLQKTITAKLYYQVIALK